jgi:signal transduction histidine kinase
VSKGRLTRQELGWLLTQEAQGAAERLRRGVSALTQAPPPPGVDPSGVDATLSALDEAMRMLAGLHPQPTSARGRRGRIDLASLLWEIAPDALVSIEPGGGTEVSGDEAELRRMLHVMLGHGSGTGSNVSIRRDGDDVVLSVVLGPDSSASADAERAWLSRMAIRYGGRYELDGSTAVLALPAEGIETRDDVERLRKELDEARKQGEAYARELAAVWTTGEEGAPSSTYPPPEGSGSVERYELVTRVVGGIASTLRGVLSPVGRDVAEVRSAQEFVAELGAFAEADPREPRGVVELAGLVQAEARALEARAARAGVEIRVKIAPEGASATARVAPRAAGVLARQLLSHAIAASRRGSTVSVTVSAPDAQLGARVIVDDGGTPVPASARRALLALQVEPGTFGRPSGIALFLAAEVATSQGALVDVGDAPDGGGVRVSVTFAK